MEDESARKPEGELQPRELVSLREYARRKGLALSTVQRAIETGRIPTALDERGRKCIDVELADVAFIANTDPSKQGRKSSPAAADGRRSGRGGDDEQQPPGDNGYLKARGKREKYVAKLKRLEYEQLLGNLVDSKEVETKAYQLARAVRESVMNVPNRIASQLAAERDPHKVRLMLEAELIKALEVISNA